MKRTYLTYILTNTETNQKYIGRTSGFGEVEKIVRRRLYNHKYFKQGFTEVEVDKAAQTRKGKLAIRGREQQLLDYHGGLNHPNVANKIRAISKLNPSSQRFNRNTNALFGELYSYTES